MLNNDNEETREFVEHCYLQAKTTVNPIIDWTTDEVWEFIREYDVPYCKLYDEGHSRLGCIGCPMGGARQMAEEFERWPKYKELYFKAFEKMVALNQAAGLKSNWNNAQDVMDWWMSL